jgi:energy-coupling factor transport system permease protein
MAQMYVDQIERSSAFKRIDVRIKLLIMLMVSTLIFVWENVLYMGAMFLVVLLVALSAHISLRYLRTLMMVMVPFIALITLIHGLFNPVNETALIGVPETVWLIGGRLTLHAEGLLFGLMVGFRILAPLIALPLIVMTTDVNTLMLGLVKLRVPYKISYIFSIALRFVPLMMAEVASIQEAQRLRGLAIENMSMRRRVPLFARLTVPLILGSLLKAQTLEVALQSKAFSGQRDRTFLNESDVRLRPADVTILAGLVAFYVTAIVARFQWGWGSFPT